MYHYTPAPTASVCSVSRRGSVGWSRVPLRSPESYGPALEHMAAVVRHHRAVAAAERRNQSACAEARVLLARARRQGRDLTAAECVTVDRVIARAEAARAEALRPAPRRGLRVTTTVKAL